MTTQTLVMNTQVKSTFSMMLHATTTLTQVNVSGHLDAQWVQYCGVHITQTLVGGCTLHMHNVLLFTAITGEAVKMCRLLAGRTIFGNTCAV